MSSYREVMAKMLFYSEFAFQQNQNELLRVPREKVLQIMDIAFKSALKREAETYRDAFQAVGEIARAYVSVRKECGRQDEFLQNVYDNRDFRQQMWSEIPQRARLRVRMRSYV